MNLSQITHLAADVIAGKPTKMRSPLWGALRKRIIADRPVCQVCGNSTVSELVAHHKKPFHLYPELELDESNIAVVCESGPGHLNCHLVVGHTGNFKQYNQDFDMDAAYVGAMLKKTGEESLPTPQL